MATKAGSMHRPVATTESTVSPPTVQSATAHPNPAARLRLPTDSPARSRSTMMRRMRHGPRRNHHRQAMPHSMACHYSAVLQPSAIHRRTRLPQCFRPQSARVEWTLLDVSPRSTFPISRAMADRMTAQRQNRADFWPATIHTAMSRQRRPPLPASAMPSSSHMLLPHQPANPIPADGITAAGEAEAHPSFHVFHKESQGMGSHAFP